MSNGSSWSTEQSQAANREIDFRAILWERKFLILILAICGGAIGYNQFQKLPPIYISNTSVYVEHQNQRAKIDDSDRMAAPTDPLDNHVVLMTTPVILKGAVEKYNLSELPSLKGNPNPAAAIAGGLSVFRPIESPDILKLSYRSGNQQDAKKILDAVVASYLEYLGESQRSSADRAVELISNAKTELAEELRRKEQEYQAFRDATGLVWSRESGQNVHQQRLTEIEQQRSELLIESSQLRAELDAINLAKQKGASRESLFMIIDQSLQSQKSGDTTVESITAKLIPLLLEESLLLESVGQEHPKMREVRKKIEVTRSLLTKAAGETQINVQPNAPQPDLLTIYLQSVQERLNVIAKKISELDTFFEKERVAASKLSADENRDRAFRDEIARINGLFSVVVETLQKSSLVKDNFALIGRVVEEPSEGYQLKAQIFTYLGIGGFLGALLGLGLGVLLETGDKRFRSPEEIITTLGAPIFGHIPTLPAHRRARPGSALAPEIVSAHIPHSTHAEAYRLIRASLLIGKDPSRCRVTLVTSPDPTDGKSTTCANLAVAMANAGKRCLLIDMDLRRPVQHKIFGLDRQIGISSFLKDGMELHDAIQLTEVDNLDVLTAGPRTDSPGELLHSPVLLEMIEVLREKYDYIIIDTPPVLAVSDATSLSPLVDETLLVMTNSKKAVPHVKKAKSYLELVNSKLVGVVVNKLCAKDGYRYEHGEYKRGTYGKSYSYGQYAYANRYTEHATSDK